VALVQVLLEHGVDANARDANDVTPLHLASDPKPNSIVGRYLHIIRLLLQYGSDIHARDYEGRTPFMRAGTKRCHKIMQLLLEHGAKDHGVWV
jgi:ankyrin repeat protein